MLSSINAFLVRMSGDDPSIVSGCSRDTRRRFVVIGLTVLIIFAVCFLSFAFTFGLLFDSTIVGFAAGSVFALTITNIYVLLLNTLTKSVLPRKRPKGRRWISIVFIVGFISMIGILVAKPLEAAVFAFLVNDEIIQFKADKTKSYEITTSEFFDSQIAEIKQEEIQERNIKDNLSSLTGAEHEKRIAELKAEKIHSISNMESLVNSSNYFVRRIIVLNTGHPFTWIVTALVVLIFVLPARLKYKLSSESLFYESKRQRELGLVLFEYQQYRNEYERVLNEHFGKSVEYEERYWDAPFNTQPKIDQREFLPEDTLLSRIYEEGNPDTDA